MSQTPAHRFDPIAGLLALAFPGFGHLAIDKRSRAAALAAGVLFLFVGGLFIGGIDVVDSREDRLWFYAELGVGPLAYATDYIHQTRFKVNDLGEIRSANPDETRAPDGSPRTAAPGQRPPNAKSVGRMNELGTLFCTMASFLNLIAVFDAALREDTR